jgi:hypothetical protein
LALSLRAPGLSVGVVLSPFRRRARGVHGAADSAKEREGGREEWAGSGTVHLGQCTVAFLLFPFYLSVFLFPERNCNIWSYQMMLQKCETRSHRCIAISNTATKSLGIFGTHLNLCKNDLGILNAELALLKYLGPSVVDDDVVFLNSK